MKRKGWNLEDAVKYGLCKKNMCMPFYVCILFLLSFAKIRYNVGGYKCLFFTLQSESFWTTGKECTLCVPGTENRRMSVSSYNRMLKKNYH